MFALRFDRSGADSTFGDPAPEASRRLTWSEAAPLVVAVIAAAVLRLWHLDHQSLWFDELASLTTALVPPGEIPAEALRHDAFEPPLYFWLLHAFVHRFGSSEWALRLLSAAAGTLTVPLVWLLVRQVTREISIANAAALLLATHPLHIWYSQEARPYALVVCLGTGALVCVARAVRQGGLGPWAGFTILSAAAILTHATGVVYPLVGGIWALHACGARARGALAIAAAAVLVLTLPFLVMLTDAIRNAGGTGSAQRPFTGLELLYTLFTFVAGYSFGPPVREIQDLGWRVAVARHPAQTLVAGAVLLWLTLLLARARRSRLFEFAVLLAVPLSAAAAGSLLSTKAYNVRYVLPSLAGFLALAAVALAGLAPRARAAGLAVMLGLFLAADVQWFGASSYWKEDSRGAATCLARRLPTGSTVAVAPPYMRGLLEHYTPSSANLHFVAVTDLAVMKQNRHDALAISRLYHLPATQEDMVRAFQSQSGGPARVERLVGYQLYFAPPVTARATGSPCGLADLPSR
jgi:4-amino-4-deoxy-L-arabinose transferase-like glycosyltransferase